MAVYSRVAMVTRDTSAKSR